MPQDYGFDAQEGVWRTSDMEVEIRSGCGVRMRIVGVDITPGRMVSEEVRVGWERGFLMWCAGPWVHYTLDRRADRYSDAPILSILCTYLNKNRTWSGRSRTITRA